jgi:RHS repeat-associated protein
MALAAAAHRTKSLNAMWKALTATSTYSYDNNGNLTARSPWTYGWDYRDRLTSAGDGSATSTYGYDHSNQRVWKKVGSQATTTYSSKYYSTQGATTTAYIYLANGELLATVEGDGTATTTSYVHADHLGSTNVVTDQDGDVVQTLDYYPYGGTRIESGTDVSDREFIGQFKDEETDLSYLNARYYEGSRGQFLSQDPVFWEIGRTPDGRAAMSNPQAMNSYSYAVGNPVIKKDPDGRSPLVIGMALAGVGFGGTWYRDIRENQRLGVTRAAQFVPREGFLGRGTTATVDTAIGFFLKNPFWSGGSVAGTSVYNDVTSGGPLNYGNALRSGIISFFSDLILGPLNDAPPTVKKDVARILSSGILNFGGNEFFKNTPTQSSLQVQYNMANQQSWFSQQAPSLPAGAPIGPGGMVRDMPTGKMPDGKTIYCSGLCSK